MSYEPWDAIIIDPLHTHYYRYRDIAISIQVCIGFSLLSIDFIAIDIVLLSIIMHGSTSIQFCGCRFAINTVL